MVSIVQCRGEELELPEKVDLIVSEWMGTMLIVSYCIFCFVVFIHSISL